MYHNILDQRLKLSRSATSCCGLLALYALAATSASAQDQPVLFIHGFTGDSNAYVVAADAMKENFQIQPILPTLHWGDSFSVQAQRLRNVYLSPYASNEHVAVAHSNGAVVTREYLRQEGAATQIDRTLLIGGLHGGAELVNNTLNGNLSLWAGGLAQSIYSPFNLYHNADPNFFTYLTYPLWQAAGLIAWFANNKALSGATLGFAIDFENIDVFEEMAPGSAQLNLLRSLSVRAAEASNVDVRVGLRTSADPNAIVFRAMQHTLPGTANDWEYARRILQYGAAAFYYYYANHEDWYLASNAYRWAELWRQLELMDIAWLYLNGSLVFWNGYYGEFVQNDALLTIHSQRYPGGLKEIDLLFPVFDIDHVEQSTVAPVLERMADVFDVDFQVPERAGSSGLPPSMTVEMLGPAVMQLEAECTWVATTNHGVDPVDFDWYRNGVWQQGGGWYTTPFVPTGSGTTMEIKVRAVDGTGAIVWGTATASESSSAPICLM